MNRSLPKRPQRMTFLVSLCLMLLLSGGSDWREDAVADDVTKSPSSNATAPSSSGATTPAAAPAATAAPASGTSTDDNKPKPPPKVVRPTIDVVPYQILVDIGISRTPEFGERFRERFLTDLTARIESRVGPLWQMTLRESEDLQPASSLLLQDLSDEQRRPPVNLPEIDQSYQLTLERDGGGYRLACQSWDVNSQTSTPMVSRTLYEPRQLADVAVEMLLSHFRPIAQIDTVSEDGKTVEFRIRGGELMPPDVAVAPFRVGDYLSPYYRYLDRKQQLQQIVHVGWTYLEVTEVNRGRMLANVISTFRSPLAGNRRRVELMGIAVKPQFQETTLVIYPRKERDNPLAGARVDVTDRRPTKEDAVPDRLTLLTDRRGQVQLPVDPGHLLRYLYIISGTTVLAQVPFIPGTDARVELEIPNDAARLTAEGQVELLEAELIETVARRAVLMARIRGLSNNDKWTEVDTLMEELGGLPLKKSFDVRLRAIQQTAVAIAQGNKDRVAVSRINKLCGALQEHIDKHLTDEKLNDFKAEMRQIRPKP
ncbi:MAG: hypothetical protein R3C01_02410 [Planctomycetaceae bacterium]